MVNKTPKSETRVKLLDAAQRLMLTKGFTATSIDEICKVAGVTKGSFFHYFDSKDDLGKAVLHHYWQPLKAMHEAPRADYAQAPDPLERLLGYCDFIIQLVEHPDTVKSCLFGTFSQELSITHPEIVAICQEAFTWWTGLIEHDLIEAKRQLRPVTDFDPKSVARHFIVVYEGSLILFKTYRDPALLRQQLEHFKEYLKLLFLPETTERPAPGR